MGTVVWRAGASLARRGEERSGLESLGRATWVGPEAPQHGDLSTPYDPVGALRARRVATEPPDQSVFCLPIRAFFASRSERFLGTCRPQAGAGEHGHGTLRGSTAPFSGLGFPRESFSDGERTPIS